MEFITVEQFQEQPLKVQKMLMDWWKCDFNGDFDYFKSIGVIPIFTEGQLRKFIEDKLDMKIQCEIHPLTLDYIILVKNNSGNEVWMHTGKEDLLQAYWKVACMIAKEG